MEDILKIKQFKEILDIIAFTFKEEIAGIQLFENYTETTKIDIAFKEQFDFVSRFTEVYSIINKYMPENFVLRYINSDFEMRLITAEWEPDYEK